MKEALKLALDFIIATNKSSGFWLVPASNLNKVVTAIKEALAPPEQEPVAWEQFYPDIGKPQLKQEPVGFMNAGHVHEMQQGRLPYGYVYPKGGVGADIAVYTTPPKRPWAGLTDEPTYTEQQIANACWAAEISDSKCESLLIALQESAHGIKENT